MIRIASRAVWSLSLLGFVALASSAEAAPGSPTGPERSGGRNETGPERSEKRDRRGRRGVHPVKHVETGDPIPSAAAPAAHCVSAAKVGGTKWIGSGPSTPLAYVTKKNEIAEPGTSCCAPWAVRGAAYHAVDRFGQIAGDAVIAGGEGYDVTQCYELMFRATRGSLGTGLFFSGAYTPAPSPEWKPTATELASLERIVKNLEQTMLATKPSSGACTVHAKPTKLASRTLFFRSRSSYTSVTEHGDTQWAVVGGQLRMFARLDGTKWTVRTVHAQEAEACNAMTHTPRAAFDMNGDGSVEVIMHVDDGDSFGDVVMGQVQHRIDDKWEVVSGGVGGSTA